MSGRDSDDFWDATAALKEGSCPWTFFGYPAAIADTNGLPPDDEACVLLRELRSQGLRVGPLVIEQRAYFAYHFDDRSRVNAAIDAIGMQQFCIERSLELYEAGAADTPSRDG
ncbi:MAG: hypothetical protein AAGH92_13690 [Planctomycetota bacterium]